MVQHFTDAEEAEARYEQMHGPIDRWTLGVIDVDGTHMTAEDVPERENAVTALEQIAADLPRGDHGVVELEAAWEAFYDSLQGEDDVSLVAPDGRRYYAELIQR